MHKLILIPFIVFGFIFTEGIFREKIYKPADEKGRISLSDVPTSPVITTKEGSAKQDGGDGGETLKRDEVASRPEQEIYKSVDERGTINFSDNPTSQVITTKKGAAKQDGAEVLKRNEVANRPAMTDSDIKAKLLKLPTWRGSASSSAGGSSRTVRRARS
jgi:hypothetical protein